LRRAGSGTLSTRIMAQTPQIRMLGCNNSVEFAAVVACSPKGLGGEMATDAIVSARFYRATPEKGMLPDFADTLLAQMGQPVLSRERDLGGGVMLRVERCEADGEYVDGQFSRKQMDNIPPQDGPLGLEPIKLDRDQGLGHICAFRFHRPTSIMLLQTNILSATPNRVTLYIRTLLNGAGTYFFEPILRQDALDRFKDRKLRGFTVSFASPPNLEALDDQGLASARGARLLAEAFNGLELSITVKAGREKRKKRFLDFENTKREINALLNSGADIDKLEVQADPTNDDEGRNIDFLEEHLKCRAELELSDVSVEKNYNIRREFLKSEFDTRLPYLLKHFGS
ncbi:MAG TPA: DUF6731 family protein, partial [Verrucomicrobiae bacterium]|nr:DUF6731 family protein [Verrucomicrobiae bacterium]